MIHLFMALHAEAAPLIDALSLRARPSSGPFRSWVSPSGHLILTLTGPGPYAAAACTSAVLNASGICPQDVLICLGSCASLDTERAPLKCLYRIHALQDLASGFRYYPDMIFRTRLPESDLLTGARVLSSRELDALRQNTTPALYDMESAAVCAAARLYLGPHQMLFLRYATDTGGESVTPESLRAGGEAHLDAVLEILEAYEAYARQLQDPLDPAGDDALEVLIQEMRCSETMSIQLRQMHRYARLTGFPWEDMIREFHDQDRLPVPGRKEGKDVLACIRTRLYTQTV